MKKDIKKINDVLKSRGSTQAWLLQKIKARGGGASGVIDKSLLSRVLSGKFTERSMRALQIVEAAKEILEIK